MADVMVLLNRLFMALEIVPLLLRFEKVSVPDQIFIDACTNIFPKEYLSKY